MADSDSHVRNFLRPRVHVRGLVMACGSIAAASTVLGFLGGLWWLLDLLSHFRVQYFLGLAVVSLLLMFLKRRKASLCFAAFAVVNLCTIVPLYLGGEHQPTDSAKVFRAMLMNVNTRHGDPVRVAEAIRQYDPDILVLAEVDVAWLAGLRDATKHYKHYTSHPRDDNFGIALYSRLPVSRCQTVYIGDAQVPSVIAEVDTDSGPYTVIGTHPLPAVSAEYSRLRNDQLAKLAATVRGATSPVILLGDLNMSPWSYYFGRFLTQSGLRDSSRGRGVQPTWPTFSPVFLIPIDHCLHSGEIKVVNREVGPRVGSDHYPLIVDLELPPAKGGGSQERN